jgi:hypothetical protein
MNQEQQHLIVFANNDISKITRLHVSNGQELASIRTACQLLYGLDENDTEYNHELHTLEGQEIDSILSPIQTFVKVTIKRPDVCCQQSALLAALCEWCNRYYGSQVYENLCSACYRGKLEGDIGYHPENQLLRIQREQQLKKNAFAEEVNKYVINDNQFQGLMNFMKRYVTTQMDPNWNSYEKATAIHNAMNQFGVDTGIENVVLSASQAHQLYPLLRAVCESWRIEHVLCARVVDKWNIDFNLMPVGECYYSRSPPRSVTEVISPQVMKLKVESTGFLRY